MKVASITGNSDSIVESKAKARISESGIYGSNGDKNLDLGVSDEVRVSSVEMDSGAPENEVHARVSEGWRSEEPRVRVSDAIDGGVARVGKEIESRGFEIEDESINHFDAQDDRFDFLDDKEEHVEKSKTSEYTSLLSEFDDFVANENDGASGGFGMSRALSFGLEVGDMVWGKVKSHPWWPGHIFNEAFASPSVRRARREGYVLVAFFGDSSYGWFDPAELIPFDLYFAEKSSQTNSRNFVKAVEEAVDEASRRRGLALACKCRNPYNFRVTSVQGYFVVDVPDYEPGGVYSANQIKKERDGFKPSETLAFVKQLALVPRGGEQKSINFLKNKATLFAHRKAVFEEFDETYAQAFGVQPGRQSRQHVHLDQTVKAPPKAPLSGPLVIAEALGGGKSAAKPVKIKDPLKKDRYLFKRRDETNNSETHQGSPGQAVSSAPSVYMDGSVTAVAGDYVLQKRVPPAPVIPPKHEVAYVSNDVATSSLEGIGKEVSIDRAAAYSSPLGHQDIAFDKEKDFLQGTNDSLGPSEFVSPTSTGWSDLSRDKVFTRVTDDASQAFQQEAEQKILRPYEGLQKHELSFPSGMEVGSGSDQVKDSRGVADLSPIDTMRSSGMTADGGIKKARILKRTTTDLGSENSVMGEKKKKKRKDTGREMNSEHPQKRLATGKMGTPMRKVAGKSTLIGLAPREDFQVEYQRKSVSASNSSTESVATLLTVDTGNSDIELPQLLSDLQALALDPFHGVERNSPAIVQLFFLRFRSLVFQKSLVLSPPAEAESVEVGPTKSSSGVGAFGSLPGEHARDLSSSKPAKSIKRPMDPTKAGRKRGPSDRQEEIAAKKLKKINAIKSLAVEKKASQKSSENRRVEGRDSVVPALPKSFRPDLVKKLEPVAKAVNPTMLVMKFPPGTSLPSVAELKAKFARFGPIDQSGLRVFWKSLTCRVVFLHKHDAEAAYRYAVANSSFLGSMNVRCYTRELGVATAEGSETGKGRGDDNTNESPRVKDPAVIQRPASGLVNQPLPKPAVQLKSCLKKSSGDESGQVAGGGGGCSNKGISRVKFMLVEDESSRGEQLMVGNRNNINNNASIADGGGAPSSVGMDFISKNFQKVSPPSPSPLPPQFANAPHNNFHRLEIAPWNAHNPINSLPAPPSGGTSVDISQPFLSLLTRCNDIVTNVTGLLGYVPYHPL
ncbi:uncharacterized protein LOC121262344 [Juglans microcarpa x Juglans regia]|uniref:uncharacterized protein LOC121262344 n=1 Tax=Juglans microcarpa x Juglans regia TaxID=2249226 RepID=UPI001B7E4D59|nr:uncharacterized protein LOC121262344 [Juglans microcarpa x Juglans regia]